MMFLLTLLDCTDVIQGVPKTDYFVR